MGACVASGRRAGPGAGAVRGVRSPEHSRRKVSEAVRDGTRNVETQGVTESAGSGRMKRYRQDRADAVNGEREYIGAHCDSVRAAGRLSTSVAALVGAPAPVKFIVAEVTAGALCVIDVSALTIEVVPAASDTVMPPSLSDTDPLMNGAACALAIPTKPKPAASTTAFSDLDPKFINRTPAEDAAHRVQRPRLKVRANSMPIALLAPKTLSFNVLRHGSKPCFGRGVKISDSLFPRSLGVSIGNCWILIVNADRTRPLLM